jgi:hypothetical protein
MNNKSNHSKTYTYADIKQYLDGNMSLDEMYAFEKAVMDDPFLADALDGFMAHRKKDGAQDIHDDLKDLSERLKEVTRLKPARTMPVPLWIKTAAAIVLLIMLGYLTDQLMLKKNRGSGDIAKKEEKTPAGAEQSARKEEPALATDTILAGQANNKPKVEVNAKDKKAGDQGSQAVSNPANMQSGESKSEKKIQVESGKTRKNVKEKFSQPPLTENAKSAEGEGVAKQRPLAASSIAPIEVFRGVVIDANSMPVREAMIRMQNSNIAASTDTHGEFNLEIKHKDPKIYLEVNALGYRPRVVEVAPDESGRNIIQLDPDSSTVKEIVVSEFRPKQLKETNVDQRNSVDLNASLATPSGGWQGFYDYINKNKKINTVDSARMGTEIISFEVDKNGKLSSFRSEQSISKAHHAEAIRLIKEGPTWNCLKGKEQRVTIYINFE